MHIEDILESLLCSEGEKKTFLTLLAAPKGLSVVSLSKQLSMPRPTLYGHVEALGEKGLIRKGLHGSGAIFHVEDAAHIEAIFNAKMYDFERAKQSVREALSQHSLQQNFAPRFTVYEGRDAYEKVFRDMLISGEKELQWIWPLTELMKQVPEQVFFDFHTERVQKGIWLHALWPYSKKVALEKHPLLFSIKEKEALRQIRLLPPEIDQTIGYGCYGSKVAFISSEREHYAFTIESKELSMMYKNHFQFLWKISKPYSVR